MELDTLLSQQNPQWSNDTYTPKEYKWQKRQVFFQLKPWIQKRFIIALTGLRRVGKSTLLKQIMGELFLTGKRKECLYLSFEKIQAKRDPEILKNTIEYYFHHILLKNIYEINNTVYLFLDEIQNIPDWQDVVKSFYDQNPKIKFFISGSDSLFTRKKSKESLAGRIIEMRILPLSFREYIDIAQPKFKPLVDDRLWITANKDILNGFFEEYLRFGQFPEVISQRLNHDQTKIYLETIEEKITQQDLPKLFPIKHPEILLAIVNQIKEIPGQRIEYQSIAKQVGLDQRTLAKYFDYLERGFFISLCFNFVKKPLKSPRIIKKAYLTSVNFAAKAQTSFLVENYLFNFLQNTFGRVHFYKDKEIDFIVIDKDRNIFLYESKYQNEIKKEDGDNLHNFMEKHTVEGAYLITKRHYDMHRAIKQIPASFIEFFLQT